MGSGFDPQADVEGRRHPTPRMMEAFDAVMGAGSVSAAARYLGISQPAVSRLLKQFEDELGFPLFHRAKGKLTPTPEAHRLSIEVGNALGGLDRVRRSAEDVRRHGVGRLRIGITPMLYEAVLHDLLKDFLQRQPNVVLTLETGLTEAMAELLLRDQVELAFASLLTSHPGIEGVPLVETETVVLMPRENALAGQSSIAVEDLAEVPLVTMTRPYASRHRIEQMFRRAGVPMRLRAEANLTGTICDLVRMGQGVAIMSGLSWHRRERDGLVARPLRPRLINRYGLLHLADRAYSRPAQQLIAALRTHLAETMPEVYLAEQ